MLTKLLAPKETSEVNAPCVEELGESTGCPDEDEADEFDWQIEQKLIPEEVNVTGPRYGFAKSKQNVFSSLRVWWHKFTRQYFQKLFNYLDMYINFRMNFLKLLIWNLQILLRVVIVKNSEKLEKTKSSMTTTTCKMLLTCKNSKIVSVVWNNFSFSFISGQIFVMTAMSLESWSKLGDCGMGQKRIPQSRKTWSWTKTIEKFCWNCQEKIISFFKMKKELARMNSFYF